jgi:signal transduction histidine kinase
VRRYLPDLAVPAAIGALLLVDVLVGRSSALDHGAVDYLLLAAGVAGMAGWRRAPVAALLVTTVATAAYTVRLHPGPPVAFAVLTMVFLAARAGHRWAAIAASAGFLTAFLAVDVANASEATGQPPVTERTVLLLGWFLTASVGGIVSRHRQAYLRQAEQRAVEAERTREETARRRATEERLRIARELHDSLTHSVSIIKLQANVAIHLARKRGEEVPEALVAIQDASGEAMRELRSTLDVLRQPERACVDRIGELVERTRAAGLDVTFAVDGQPRAVSAEVDQAAFRIVQEALTNVGRHAGSAAAAVRLDYRTHELVVRVDDDGPATTDAAPVYGNGLTGMRERVTALGGQLHARARAEGGFVVRAALPLSVDAERQ